MAYKDLLVHVDDTRSCAARLQAAVDLAIAHEAHLTGVYIIAESPAVFATGHVPPELLESLQQRTRELAEGALARFAEVAGRNQISFETGSTGCSTPKSRTHSPRTPAMPTWRSSARPIRTMAT